MDSSSSSSEFNTPISFRLSKWWGFALSAMFLLYGGFRILFAILDREAQSHTGQDIGLFEPILLLAIGALLFLISYEFSQGKRWGWLALLSINGLILCLAAVQLFGVGSELSQTDVGQQYNIVLVALAVLGLGALLVPATQRLFTTARR